MFYYLEYIGSLRSWSVVMFASGLEVHYRVCCCEWIDVGFRFYCYDIYGEHGIGKLASSELSCMSSLGDDMAYYGECSVKLFGDAVPGAVYWPFFSRILLWYWCRDFNSDLCPGGNGGWCRLLWCALYHLRRLNRW